MNSLSPIKTFPGFQLRLTVLFLIAGFVGSAFAQQADEVLAAATGLSFTASSLSPEARKIYDKQKSIVVESRTRILSQLVADMLLEAEAKSQNITVEALIALRNKIVPQPTDAEIKSVYEANRTAFGDKTLGAVRPQIVSFLRSKPEQEAMQKFVDSLTAKYKVVIGRDVNAPDLNPLEALVSMNGTSISVQEFEEKNKLELYDVRAEIADEIRFDLENSVFSALVTQEAKARNIEAGDLLAVEVTNKLRDFSDAERAEIEGALKRKLFSKYDVKFLLKEPEPLIQIIAVDDDPFTGMGHGAGYRNNVQRFPVFGLRGDASGLKKVLSEYREKVRFVVRDFPLTGIHKDAFPAAIAAYAANGQGKYFEYIDILYRNQDALDMESLKKYAANLGLNVKQFALDLSSEKASAEVRKDMAEGKTYGILETPTIYVNGVKIRHLSADGFRNAIDKAISNKRDN